MVKVVSDIIYGFFAVMLLLLSGCRKIEPDFNLLSEQSSYTRIQLDFSVFPAANSTGNHTESDIRISYDSNFVITGFNNAEIIVGDGATDFGCISGLNNGVIEFVTKQDLKPNTDYTVAANLNIAGYQINDSSSLRVALFNQKWKFRTGEITKYKMTKTSNWASAFRRDGSKLMQVGNYLYMYGGWTSEPLDSYNDVYRSSDDLYAWEKLTDAPWHARHTFGIGKINNEVYVFGGDNIYKKFDVWKTSNGYDFDVVATNLDSTVGDRILYGACSHKNQLFVLGGQTAADTTSLELTDVWQSSDGDYWQQLASNKPFLGKNLSGSVGSFNDKLWVVGGGYYKHPDSSLRYTNEVYSSVDGIAWTKEPDAPWIGRQYADVHTWNNKLWMVGGDNFGNLKDIWYLDKQGEWTEFIPPSDFEARHASAIGTYNDKLVIACGNYWNDCWIIEKE